MNTDPSHALEKNIINMLEQTQEEEISRDIIQIMNIYVAKINGMRKYKRQIKSIFAETK